MNTFEVMKKIVNNKATASEPDSYTYEYEVTLTANESKTILIPSGLQFLFVSMHSLTGGATGHCEATIAAVDRVVYGSIDASEWVVWLGGLNVPTAYLDNVIGAATAIRLTKTAGTSITFTVKGVL